MLLGVVSDTHGHVQYARQAVNLLDAFKVEAVIHCGDIGSPSIVPLFRAWPTHIVLGNVDHFPGELEQAIAESGQTCHGRFGAVELGGVRIGFLHSDDADRFRGAIESARYDLVCYGHTHFAEHHRVGKTLVLNPGALYRANPHTLAIVDLPSLNVTIVPVA